jgi:hypothetical protein
MDRMTITMMKGEIVSRLEGGEYALLICVSDSEDPTETPGFVIHTLLHSIDVQIQTLKRLTRSLQEATPDARQEVISVTRLIEETAHYFGSDAALKRHSVDVGFAGGKALDETRTRAM